MPYVDDTIMLGETVIHRTRLHWIVFLYPLLLFILACALALTIARESPTIGLSFLAIGLLPAIKRLVEFTTSEFAITNKRVLVKVGFIARKSLEILLAKVESIRVDQSILGRLFDYGSIVISGTGGSHDLFHNISSPFVFRRAAQQQIAEAQDLKQGLESARLKAVDS